MFCALALAAGLAACGGGGLSADALTALSESQKPVSPGNSLNSNGKTAKDPNTTTTDQATTTTSVTDPVATTTTTAAATTTTTPSTLTPGTYALAALGSPRILISDGATLSRLRALVNAQAPSAMRFKDLVDAQLAGANAYGFQPWYAGLMSQITNSIAYCRYAVDQTENFVAAEEALIAAGQAPKVAFDSYLYVGGYIGNLSLVYDWCRAQMTDSQRARWYSYANQAVANTWDRQHAVWGVKSYATGAAGWGTNNPLNNYYYSFLQATMLLGLATYAENPQSQDWLDMFRVTKIQNQLIPKFAAELVGGGSREGTGYGVAMARLFMLYDWWQKSTGEHIVDLTPHAKASLSWEMHTIVPTLNAVSATGDHSREAYGHLYDYERNYLQVLISLYPGEAVSGAAKTLLAQSSVPKMGSSSNFYSDFLYDQTDVPALLLGTLATAYWGSGTGQFMTRSSWSTDATYINFTSGPYTENHAHQDQGSFVLYKGTWLAFDAGQVTKSGTQGTQVDPMGPLLHNLVRFEQNGTIIKQTQGTVGDMAAVADNQYYSYALAKTTPNYAGKAAVVKVERELLFIKPGALVVFDRAATTGAGMKRIWTLNLPTAPIVNGDRMTMASGSNRLDVIRLAPAGLTAQVVSWPSVSANFVSGARVDVADGTGDNSVFLNVLGTDGVVVNAARSDAAGQTGAQITLADGRVATVRFSTTGSGGTIDIRNPDGSVVTAGALPSGVQPLPLTH